MLDHYFDETVLEHLSKSASQIKVYRLTKTISKHWILDIEKYKAQYKKDRGRFNLTDLMIIELKAPKPHDYDFLE